MARRYEHSFQPHGHPERVGYSSKSRNGQLSVVFIGPDRKRVELSTGLKKENETWHQEAERVIAKAFAPLVPVSRLHTFASALEEVKRTSPITRPETLRSFSAAVKALAEVHPRLLHVEDVTPEHVTRFGKLWLAGKGRGGKPRSPVTLSYYQRALSAFYNHLVEMGYAAVNPWKGAKTPKAPKNKKPVPREDQVTHFFAWVAERYPDWLALRCLLELKAVSGSRTFDVCQLKSDQVQGGRLRFDASQTKTNEGRDIPLPPELFGRLCEVKGKEFLWEQLFAEIPRYRKASNGYPDSFSPRTVYFVVNNLFREYNDSHPDKPRFTPHGLRRRAITRVVMATGNVDLTAQAIGLHPQTARAYYLDAKAAFDTDGVFQRLAETLLPDRGKIEGIKGKREPKNP